MREFLLKLLTGESADQIIWTADISYWIDGQRQIGQAHGSWLVSLTRCRRTVISNIAKR